MVVGLMAIDRKGFFLGRVLSSSAPAGNSKNKPSNSWQRIKIQLHFLIDQTPQTVAMERKCNFNAINELIRLKKYSLLNY